MESGHIDNVAKLYNGFFRFGKIDQHGFFVEYPERTPQRHQEGDCISRGSIVNYYNKMDSINYTAINIPLHSAANERVFEYRSGRLIEGIISNEGVFSPEIGTQILTIQSFLGNNDIKPRIYNVPDIVK